MRRILQISAILCLAAAGLYAGFRFMTPEQAAINCPEIQNCLSQGYVMESCVQQPIYYFVAPTGTYEWGHIVTGLRADPEVGPPLSITCDITARQGWHRVVFWETANHVHIVE